MTYLLGEVKVSKFHTGSQRMIILFTFLVDGVSTRIFSWHCTRFKGRISKSMKVAISNKKGGKLNRVVVIFLEI